MKLVSKLNKIAANVETEAAIAIQDTAQFILSLIRLYAPVDTGWLRDSYKKEDVAMLHILIGTMVNYSVFQELGTSRAQAQPHLVPAFHGAEAVFQKNLLARMKNLG